MFIIYDCAACILVALIAATLLCTGCAIVLLIKSGADRVARTLQKLTQGPRSAIADKFSGRTLGKSLAPVPVPLVYRGEARK
jgi:hypothetical protein